jgi:hypothetical protein
MEKAGTDDPQLPRNEEDQQGGASGCEPGAEGDSVQGCVKIPTRAKSARMATREFRSCDLPTTIARVVAHNQSANGKHNSFSTEFVAQVAA